jgi:hypothetical protein
LCPLAIHERLDGRALKGIATDESMRSQLPEISRPTSCYGLGWQNVVIGITRFLGNEPLNERVDFRDCKSSQTNIEFDIRRHQALELLC